ncbi:MAG TPA: hypothetical protein VF101_12275 [Gaiellaceae bacterium]
MPRKRKVTRDPVEEAVKALREEPKDLQKQLARDRAKSQSELDARLAEPLARLARIASRRSMA